GRSTEVPPTTQWRMVGEYRLVAWARLACPPATTQLQSSGRRTYRGRPPRAAAPTGRASLASTGHRRPGAVGGRRILRRHKTNATYDALKPGCDGASVARAEPRQARLSP